MRRYLDGEIQNTTQASAQVPLSPGTLSANPDSRFREGCSIQTREADTLRFMKPPPNAFCAHTPHIGANLFYKRRFHP